MAVIIAYEEELPKYVNSDFTRYKVSLFIPSPLRCAKCQRYGHKAGQCRSENLGALNAPKRMNTERAKLHQRR